MNTRFPRLRGTGSSHTIIILLSAVVTWGTHPLIAAEPANNILEGRPLDYKVGFLGIPSSRTQFEMSIPVPWTRETIGRLRELGFNTIQLNVAWGRRPGDEPLNIEDVVQLTPERTGSTRRWCRYR